MLAIHPHRERGDAAPEITAILDGPGWTTAFSDTLELGACTRAEGWPGPARCLRAPLPDAVHPGVGYRLHGTAPLGSFTGEMVVPNPPLLLQPPDSLLLPVPDRSMLIEIPIRFRVGPGIGTLLAEVLDVFEIQEDGTETEIAAGVLGHFPQPIEAAEADTIKLDQRGRPLRFSLRLLGIGRNYTKFLAEVGIEPLLRPWPSFGIRGEGVYGYFDGVTTSRAASIEVR